MSNEFYQLDFDLENLQHMMRHGTNSIRISIATRLCHIVHASLRKLDATISIGEIGVSEDLSENERHIRVEVEYNSKIKDSFKLDILFPYYYSGDPHNNSRVFYPTYEIFALGNHVAEDEPIHPLISVDTLTALVASVENNPARLAQAKVVELPRQFDIIRRNGELLLCVQDITRDTASVKEMLADQANEIFEEFSEAIDGEFQADFDSDDVSARLIRLGVRTPTQARKLTDDELKELVKSSGLDLSANEYMAKLKGQLATEPLMTQSVQGIDLPTIQFVNLETNSDHELGTVVGELFLDLEAGYSVVDRFVLQSDVKNLIQQNLAHSQSTTDLLEALDKL